MAARRHLSAKGIAGTSLRAVAKDAGVDPALINHYFGSKAGLVSAALNLPADPVVILSEVLPGDPDTLGERLAGRVLKLWEEPTSSQALIALLRSAVVDEHSAELLGSFLSEAIGGLLATALAGELASTRASLAAATLLGVVMARHVLKLEPMASLPLEELALLVGAEVQSLLRPA